MTESADRALATVLLTTHLLHRPHTPLSTREFWKLVEQVEDPARLLGCTPAEVQRITGFREGEAERVASLLSAAAALEDERERLEQLGIRILSSFDEHYPARLPERLGAGAPPVLHVAGNPELLAQDGIGIVGSRNVGAEALEAAQKVAAAAVAAGLPVISGGAKGIDQAAMGAALQAGGRVVGLPADAMMRLLKDSSVHGAIDEGRLCLATPYAPSAGFSVGAAMARNKLIYGLAQVTLVVTSDDGTGGTWAGATEALKRRLAPVAVWMGPEAGPGNAKLVRDGGVEVKTPAQVLSCKRDEAPNPADKQLRMIF